jgi:hypothetical protein
MISQENAQRLRSVLLALMDQIDYRNGACRVNELVGAVLSPTALRAVDEILEATKG